MGTVVAVASGKGGTGKTSFCANVAVALCALGEKVLLIDADAGLRSLDLVLGMTDSLLFSYADVIGGIASLKEASVKHPVVKNLRVLTAPASMDACQGITREKIAALVNRARMHFTYTLIDCAAGLADDVLCFAEASDRAVVVTTPDYTSLRGAQTTGAAFQDVGLDDVKIVVNRVREGMMNTGDAVNIDKAMDSAGLALLGVVPEDEDVIACANRGEVLALHSFGGAFAAYGNIAKRLVGRRVRLLEGVKGRF